MYRLRNTIREKKNPNLYESRIPVFLRDMTVSPHQFVADWRQNIKQPTKENQQRDGKSKFWRRIIKGSNENNSNWKKSTMSLYIPSFVWTFMVNLTDKYTFQRFLKTVMLSNV